MKSKELGVRCEELKTFVIPEAAKQLSGIQRFLILAIVLGSFMPFSAMAQKCIYYAVPGEITLSIDNNTSEQEAARVLTGYADKGISLDIITSESLLISLDYHPGMDTDRILKDPYVTWVRKTEDHVSIFFDGKVTDKYARDLVETIPDASIQHITQRKPRQARITVPAGQEQQWSEQLASLPFVRDATPVCASRYRATCEQYGGTISLSNHGQETCQVPKPRVAWNKVLDDKRAECRRSGGTWTVSRDTCIDNCSFEQDRFCWEQITEYCDCGADKCWYKEPGQGAGKTGRGTCITNPAWLKRFKQ